MRALVSHPTGNANLRAVLRGLEGAGLSAEFWTTLALPKAVARSSALSEGMRRRLSQRCFPEVLWENTHIRPFRETVRLAARGAQIEALTRHETGLASVDAVYGDLDRAVAKHLGSGCSSASLVYAYEDGALETFRAAGKMELTRVYDLPIAHWRTLRHLLEEEAERLPEWAPTMEGLRDSSAKHDKKDAEIELADHIVVASSFTRQSLQDHFGDIAVHVTPYGCPPPSGLPFSERSKQAPIELFFAGHLAQRKGIADLIAALRMLDVDWRLTLAGPKPSHAPRALDDFLADPRCTWLGVVPHSTLLEYMGRAHVFVFPSIVEGFGMVITEALSAGLPVITTSHTAGPDILTEGVEGFVVPIRSPEALADRITQLTDNEDKRRDMARAAIKTARNMCWARYEAQIAELVNSWSQSK
jgi:starch synthase